MVPAICREDYKYLVPLSTITFQANLRQAFAYKTNEAKGLTFPDYACLNMNYIELEYLPVTTALRDVT